MGMYGSLVRVSSKDLRQYQMNSDQFETLINKDETLDADWFLDLEKNWEGIHFLLCGKSLANTEDSDFENNTLSKVIFNDQILDEEQDLGYGPASFNVPNQVKLISNELNKLDLNQLKNKIDAKVLNKNEVYPQYWENEERMDWLFESLESVINFYSDASKQNQAIIAFIS